MLSYLCVVLVFVAVCNAQTSTGAPAASSAAPVSNAICKQRNGYYKVDASCDSYVECVEFTATEITCPDGLHFNPDAKWPNYPCGYPMDVPCLNRGAVQPAQPTDECPHQYGYFPSPAATPKKCGHYRMCVAGKAIDMICSTGLAFNPDTGRCDWPDLVASCNANDFLGFTCPAPPTDANGNLIDIILNYKYPGNCYYFFACEKGRARLLSCDPGLAFDPTLQRCVDADRVDCGTPADRASV